MVLGLAVGSVCDMAHRHGRRRVSRLWVTATCTIPRTKGGGGPPAPALPLLFGFCHFGTWGGVPGAWHSFRTSDSDVRRDTNPTGGYT